MKIILDHCVPRPLAAMLVGQHVNTTEKMGWQDESNGRLLALAAAGFDALLTVDKSLSRQQNLTDLPIPVIVMRCRSNSINALARRAGVAEPAQSEPAAPRVHSRRAAGDEVGLIVSGPARVAARCERTSGAPPQLPIAE